MNTTFSVMKYTFFLLAAFHYLCDFPPKYTCVLIKKRQKLRIIQKAQVLSPRRRGFNFSITRPKKKKKKKNKKLYFPPLTIFTPPQTYTPKKKQKKKKYKNKKKK